MIPAGVTAVHVFLNLPGWPAGGALNLSAKRLTPPTATLTVTRPAAEPGQPGRATAVLAAPAGGLQPGLYEVTASSGGRRETATFLVVAGAAEIIGQTAPAEAEVLLSKGVIAGGVAADGKPTKSLKEIRDPAARLWLVFRYDQAEPGTSLTVRWFSNNVPLPGATRELALRGAAGWAHAWLQASPRLPAGTLRAEVTLTGDAEVLLSVQVPVQARPGS